MRVKLTMRQLIVLIAIIAVCLPNTMTMVREYLIRWQDARQKEALERIVHNLSTGVPKDVAIADETIALYDLWLKALTQPEGEKTLREAFERLTKLNKSIDALSDPLSKEGWQMQATAVERALTHAAKEVQQSSLQGLGPRRGVSTLPGPKG